MKKLVLILLCLPIIGFGQFTFVPDSLFEAYLEANGLGNNIPNDSTVFTSAIDTVIYLNVSSSNIADLTGIKDFIVLDTLDCSSNNLDSIDISSNNLSYFDCSDNQFNHIDVSSNLGLLTFKSNFNNLTQLNVSLNTSLLYFECYKNQLTSLDISNNVFLTELWCNDNNLTSLDVAGIDMYVLVCDNNQLTIIDNLIDNISLKHLSCSGNNIASLLLSAHPQLNWLSCSKNQLFQLDISSQLALNYLFVWDNPSLNCINVADVALANATWSFWDGQTGNIDGHHYFSANCILSSTLQLLDSKQLSLIINLKGQQSRVVKNQPLFYKYNDGSVEQKIILE